MSALREAMSHAVLGWVKPELDESLRQVRNEIEAFVEEPADTSRMRFCSGYLHQVQGTLRMVELYAPAMVAEELELLAQALQEQQVEDVDAACAVLMRGAVLLPDYLERLQDGHRDIPIVLLPLLNEIRDARGATGLNESMLFPAGAPAQDAPTEEEIHHARGSLSGRNRALLDTVGSAVKEELLRVKDALDLHLRTSADAAQLHGQVTELGNVADTLGMMGLGVARGVVLQQRDTLRDVAEGRRAANEDTLLDIAGALLYVDASLDDQVARLGHADASHVESGSAAESQATVQVLAQEAINNFAAAREKFVAFIETNWSHEQLADVPRLLDEVSGALRMLELGQAADYLVGVRRYVGSELINKKRIPGGQQLDTLADAMASLEYYLEALRERRPNREEILEITRNSLETLRYWPLPDEELFTAVAPAAMVDVPAIPDIPPATDDAGHGYQAASAEVPAADASSHPFDPISFEEAGQAAPDSDAVPMQPALQHASIAADALSLQPLEFDGHELTASAEAAAASAGAAPVVTAPTRQGALVGGVDGFDSESGDIDDEIREVFLEEFDEEIVNLQRMLPNWRSAPEDLERLRPIRRVFHTLKGSGRLVGAKTLGEFSWKVENMLNRVLDGSRPPSEAVVVLLEQACEVLPQLNAALRGEGAISADLEGLKQVADQLAAGEEASYQPATVAAVDSGMAVELEDEIPAVAWDEDEFEPTFAWQQSTEGTPASVDAVLREILEVEVATHLRTVQAWLAHAGEHAAAVDDALLRALHTMNGAFAMADVPEITEVTNPAEQYVKRLLAQSASADADGIAALGEAVRAIQDTIAALQRPMPRVPVFAELSARLAALKDRLPEARHSQLVNSAQQGSYVGGLAGADASVDAAAEPTLQVHDLSQYLGEGTPAQASADPVNYFEVEYTFTPRAHSAVSADGEQAAAAAGLSAAPLANALREGIEETATLEPVSQQPQPQPLSDGDAVTAGDTAATAAASESSLQELPVQELPVEQPPMEQPPAQQPPLEEPPVEQPPAQEPPAEQPPAQDPPAEEPPVEAPPLSATGDSAAAADISADPADQLLELSTTAAADDELITLEVDTDGDASDQALAWDDLGAGLEIEEITLDADTVPAGPTAAGLSLPDEALVGDSDDSDALSDANINAQASAEALLTTDSLPADDTDDTNIDFGLDAAADTALDTAVSDSAEDSTSGTEPVADLQTDDAIDAAVADIATLEAEATTTEANENLEMEAAEVAQAAEVELEVEPEAETEAEAEAEASVPAETVQAEPAPFVEDSVAAGHGVDALASDASASFADAGDAMPAPMPADSEHGAAASADALRDLDDSDLDAGQSAEGDDVLDTSGLDLELVDIFVEEGNDLLDHSDGLLAQLSETPDDRALLTSLQRDLHTLKGGARMAGIHSIGDLGHAIESMLEAIVADRIQLDPRVMQLMERGFDALHGMVARVSSQRAARIPAGMVAEFNAHARGLDAPAAAVADVDEVAAKTAAERTLAPLSAPVDTDFGQDEEFFPSSQQEQVRVRSDLLDQLVNHAGEVAIYRARLEQQLGAFRGAMSELDRTNTRLHDQLRRLDLETEAQIVARYQREHEKPDATFDPLELDRFSTLQQLSRALAESAADLTGLQGVLDELARQYDGLLHQQSRVSSELQDGLMRARMVPFEGIVPRLRRVLRQAASDTGKQVKLQLSGTHGEMDRNVLERMTAPLEHLMRNSVAHGLETPQARRAAGKPAEGNVQVTLRREGSEMVLEVSDDGAGLNRDAIRKRAEQRGLLQPGVQLADVDLDRMILESGFSTYDKVSQLAGRGVGMDVVHNEVRQLGGSLDIRSSPGHGATFTLRLPQTLAVTQAVFVQIGDTQFAVPVAAVSGIGRISRERFEAEGGVYHYAGEDYTLYNLGGLVGHPPARAEGQPQVPLLLVRAGELRAAVAVDAVLGNREIVVKPVGPQIASIPGIYGATITGDGSIVVILDVAPLVRRHLAAPQQPTGPSAALQQRHVPLVMVVDDSLTMRKVTGRVLERHNLEVMVARDGVEALERLDERVPDLMLLDIEMPRMDGYELATAMKADVRFKDVPIVMITSRTGDKHRQRAFDIGVQRYMGKPYQELDLMRNVYDLLGMARVRD